MLLISTSMDLRKIQLIYFYFPPSFNQTVVVSVLFEGKTVENKGELILTEIFPSVQKHDI